MHTITKHKKITIKFFLNKKIIEAITEDDKPLHPLYIQVTYNRKNMQLRSKYGMEYLDMKELKDRGKGICEWEEKVLRKIIRYEINRLGEKFELKGLSKKYEVYASSLQNVIDKHLKQKLHQANFKINDDLPQVLDFNNERVPFSNLLKASQLLFENHDKYLNDELRDQIKVHAVYNQIYPLPYFKFSFATVIDWLESEQRNDMRKQLESIYAKQPTRIEHIIDVIDQIVTEFTNKLN